jgi:hypothetical protein
MAEESRGCSKPPVAFHTGRTDNAAWRFVLLQGVSSKPLLVLEYFAALFTLMEGTGV